MDKIEIVVRCIEKDATKEIIVASFDENESLPADLGIMTFPGLQIFINQQRVYRNGKLLSLTSREFHTLVYLSRHPEWVFGADMIYENVWQEPTENRGTAVANVIYQLRHKLNPDAPRDGYIQTVIGDGYRFVIPE